MTGRHISRAKGKVAYLSSLKLLTCMSSFIPSQLTIADAFSVTGLALVGLTTYFFRNYTRVLDCVQLFYLFAAVLAANGGEFSLLLGWGSLTFLPSFFTAYCVSGDYLCTYGYLISAGTGWLAVALLMLIIIKLVSCKRHTVRYEGFYNFWKGMLRWFMAPLVYYSTLQVINQVKTNNFLDRNFYASAGVCLFFVVWILFVELIGYKLAEREEENSWKKWCDAFSHFRIASVAAILAVSAQSNSLAKYFVYGPIVLYDIVFLTKYKFTFKFCERFSFIIQQGVLIAVFSLFLFNSQYVYTYNIDLFGLAIVILFEILVFFPKLAAVCKSGQDEEDPIVNPEIEIERRGSPRKADFMGEPSYDNLRGSDASPRRNQNRRR